MYVYMIRLLFIKLVLLHGHSVDTRFTLHCSDEFLLFVVSMYLYQEKDHLKLKVCDCFSVYVISNCD